MFLLPPLYFQLYSLWLVTESQRLLLQMVHDSIVASRSATGSAADLGRHVAESIPTPLSMPRVESTPV